MALILHLKSREQPQILTDVFGNNMEKITGLIDVRSKEEFDTMVHGLQGQWNDKIFPLFQFLHCRRCVHRHDITNEEICWIKGRNVS